MRWDPEQYLAFDDLRLRPALDLMMRVRARPAARWSTSVAAPAM